jgi:hypothetical protein
LITGDTSLPGWPEKRGPEKTWPEKRGTEEREPAPSIRN